MSNDRFELIEEPTGTWAVYDNTIGVPASIHCRVLIGLSKEDAEACLASFAIDAGVSPSASTTSDERSLAAKAGLVE